MQRSRGARKKKERKGILRRTSLFDVLGSVAFTPVKNDMTGNIKKLRERQLAAPLESETLQDLCRNELKTKKHTATEGLVWLNRYVVPAQDLDSTWMVLIIC